MLGFAGPSVAVGSLDGLVEVGKNIPNVLDSDGKANQLGCDAGPSLLLDGELLMGGRGGVNHQRLRVANVCDEREEFEGVDQFLARLVATLDPEGDERSLAGGQVFLCPRMVGARLQ